MEKTSSSRYAKSENFDAWYVMINKFNITSDINISIAWPCTRSSLAALSPDPHFHPGAASNLSQHNRLSMFKMMQSPAKPRKQISCNLPLSTKDTAGILGFYSCLMLFLRLGNFCLQLLFSSLCCLSQSSGQGKFKKHRKATKTVFPCVLTLLPFTICSNKVVRVCNLASTQKNSKHC